MLKPKQYRQSDIWKALDEHQRLYGHEATYQMVRGYEAIQAILCSIIQAEKEIGKFLHVLVGAGYMVAPEIGFDERIHQSSERFKKRKLEGLKP